MDYMRRIGITAAYGAAIVLAVAGCAFLGSGPEASITVDLDAGTVPLTIHYDGSSSTASAGISTYHWEFGTGDESYETSGTYTYQHAGAFELTLTVRAENGKTDSEEMLIRVEPAIWLTDGNLDRVYRLDMTGTVLDAYDLPAKEPRGVAIADVSGIATLIVACANEGAQRLLYLDPVTGALKQTLTAPAQSPRQLTYGATGQKQIWHVDGLSRKLYRLNPPNAQVYESYGQTYFKATSPQVKNVPFLWDPQGLDWTPLANSPGTLWYLEGQTHLLYRIKMIPGYDIMSNTQLQIEGDPVEISAGIFPVAAIDLYDGVVWAIDVDRHRIVRIDPETGTLVGTSITGFPGSAPSGLEIQH